MDGLCEPKTQHKQYITLPCTPAGAHHNLNKSLYNWELLLLHEYMVQNIFGVKIYIKYLQLSKSDMAMQKGLCPMFLLMHRPYDLFFQSNFHSKKKSNQLLNPTYF